VPAGRLAGSCDDPNGQQEIKEIETLRRNVEKEVKAIDRTEWTFGRDGRSDLRIPTTTTTHTPLMSDQRTDSPSVLVKSETNWQRFERVLTQKKDITVAKACVLFTSDFFRRILVEAFGFSETEVGEILAEWEQRFPCGKFFSCSFLMFFVLLSFHSETQPPRKKTRFTTLEDICRTPLSREYFLYLLDEAGLVARKRAVKRQAHTIVLVSGF
jgi:hypothetical protein